MPLLRRVLAPLLAREVALHLRHGGLRASTVCLRYHARAYGSAQDESADKDGERKGASPKLDFSNTKEAFRSKRFSELLRHYLVYRSFSFNRLVDNSQMVHQCSGQTPTHTHYSSMISVHLVFPVDEDVTTFNGPQALQLVDEEDIVRPVCGW